MEKKLGFIGLGNIGSMMALRLIKQGYDVTLFDINRDRIADLVSQGGRSADSLPELAENTNVILTSLPNSAIVRDVYLGENGLLKYASENTCFIELSTIDPQTIIDIQDEAIKRELHVLDAPVSGGPPEAEVGELVILAGASEEIYQKYYDILDTLAREVFLVGDVGTGKIVKLVNNMITLGNVLVASEAFQLGVGAGLNPETLYNVLTKCAGRSFQFEKRFPKLIQGDFNPGFSIDLGAKDLTLALEMASQFDKKPFLAEHIHQVYQTAQSMGYGNQDIIAMGKVSEHLLSSSFQKSGVGKNE